MRYEGLSLRCCNLALLCRLFEYDQPLPAVILTARSKISMTIMRMYRVRDNTSGGCTTRASRADGSGGHAQEGRVELVLCESPSDCSEGTEEDVSSRVNRS